MRTEDIEEQIQEIYEVDLDQTTVSKITNTMLENIKEWKSRLLKQEYYILWTDGISIRIRHYGQAAVLAEIVDSVYTVEIVEELGKIAEDRLMELGYYNVVTKIGDGYQGWKEKGPFDAIVVTAAADHIPQPLIDQLKEGGCMIIPVGAGHMTQQLVLMENKRGKVYKKNLMHVRFVPFTRPEDH